MRTFKGGGSSGPTETTVTNTNLPDINGLCNLNFIVD